MTQDPLGTAGTVIVFAPPGKQSPVLTQVVDELGLIPRFIERSRDLLPALREHTPQLILLAPWTDRAAAAVDRLESQAPGYLKRCIVVIDDEDESLLGRLLGKRGLGKVVSAVDGVPSVVTGARAILDDALEELPTLPPVVTSSKAHHRDKLSPGAVIADRFVVKEMLGRGGAAEVYLVEDSALKQDLALKLVRPDSAVPQVEDRFRQELAITRQLAHPNIVRTFDFGTHRDRLYFTMELLDGPTMQTVFEERFAGPWPCIGLDRMVDVAKALAAAHEAGVVHRDVKPDNVFLVDGGRTAKLADFGIAKPAASALAQTMAGTVLGTLEYMAPERLITDLPATPAADTYAIGAMLYVDWTGRLPHTADSDGDLVDAIIHEAPRRPRELNPGCPAGVESLIQRLLHKKARRRLADAKVVAAQLEALADEVGGGPA